MPTATTVPTYLVRIRGRDEADVVALRTPGAYEREGGPACYWFETPTEREIFLSSIPASCWVMKDTIDPAEHIDTRVCTWARITLQLPDGRRGTFDQSVGYGYPASSVESMWYSGNYSCDCNKRLFLARECDIDPEFADLEIIQPCGSTIALVSLNVFYKPLGE